LAGRSAVYHTSFDQRRAELTVLASPSFDALTEAKALSTGEEYALVLGAGKGRYVAWAKAPEGADMLTVGEDVPSVLGQERHQKRLLDFILTTFSRRLIDPLAAILDTTPNGTLMGRLMMMRSSLLRQIADIKMTPES
jgi:hypothetical protein